MSSTSCHDYDAASGTVTFHGGEQYKSVAINILDDLLPELDETFFVNLSNPTGATISDGQGLGTILGYPNDPTDGPYENGMQLLVTAPDAGPVITVNINDAR